MNELLKRLEDEIEFASDWQARACIMAKRAIYLARFGRIQEAKEVDVALREKYGAIYDLELTSWLCLLEGLIIFQSTPDLAAYDRVMRSYYLGRALKRSEIHTLSAAWLAHLEFNRGEFKKFIPLLQEALSASSAGQHQTLQRIALTAADALHFCDDFSLSNRWYQRARSEAIHQKDQTGMSSTLHNIAVLRIHGKMLAHYFGGPRPAIDEHVHIELNSSRNYDKGIDLASMEVHEPIARFQLNVLNQQYEIAMGEMKFNPNDLESHGLGRYQALIISLIALCKIKIGEDIDLDSELGRLNGALQLTSDCDDRALALAIMSAAFDAGDRAPVAKQLSALAKTEYDKHAINKATLHVALLDVVGPPEKWQALYGY